MLHRRILPSPAQQATPTVPIVMAVGHEPVAFGFVKSLAHPGGNITELAVQDSELGTKRLELLKAIVPRMRRVALLWDAGSGGELGVRALKASAQKRGLATQVLEVRRREDFGPAFASARNQGAHAVIQIASPFLSTSRARLIELAAAPRLPMTCETVGADIRESILPVAGWRAAALRGNQDVGREVGAPTPAGRLNRFTALRTLGRQGCHGSCSWAGGDVASRSTARLGEYHPLGFV